VQKQMLGEVKKLTGHLRQVVSEIFVPKKYQNLTIGFQVTVENVENVFFETQCIYIYIYIQARPLGVFSRAMARTTLPHARVKPVREPKFKVNI